MKNPESQTLVDHIEALRAALLRCLVAVAAAFPAGLLAAWPGVRWLVWWMFPEGSRELYFSKLADPFILKLRLAAMLAVLLACPFILWEIWKFVAPGLRVSERRAVTAWFGWAVVLFTAGAALAVGFVMPLVVRFFLGFQGEWLTALPDLRAVFDLVLWVPLAFGLMFQFPIFLLMLVRFGVVRVEALARARPYVIVGLLIVAAFLTPPDVISQVALAVPTWLLYEVALLVARRAKRHEVKTMEVPEGDYGLDEYERENNVTNRKE